MPLVTISADGLSTWMLHQPLRECLLWYRLSRQKSTNFESELSSTEKSLQMMGAIHRKRCFVVQ